MENYDYANSCKPSQGLIHCVETAPSQRATRMLYTRTSASSKDKIFTDLGNFTIATTGIPNSSSVITVGELWVSYKVKLSRAKLFGVSISGTSIAYDCFSWTGTAAHLVQGAILNQPGVGSIGGNVLDPSSNTFKGVSGFINTGSTTTDVAYVFPATVQSGTYRVDLMFTANASTNGTQFWNYIASCQSLNPLNYADGGVSGAFVQLPAVRSTTATSNVIFYNAVAINVASPSLVSVDVTIPASNTALQQGVLFQLNAALGANSICQMRVTQVNPNSS